MIFRSSRVSLSFIGNFGSLTVSLVLVDTSTCTRWIRKRASAARPPRCARWCQLWWYLLHILTLFTSFTSLTSTISTIMGWFFCKQQNHADFAWRISPFPLDVVENYCWIWTKEWKEWKTSSDHKRVLKRFSGNNRWTIKRWFFFSFRVSSLHQFSCTYYRAERELTNWRIRRKKVKLGQRRRGRRRRRWRVKRVNEWVKIKA